MAMSKIATSRSAWGAHAGGAAAAADAMIVDHQQFHARRSWNAQGAKVN
jgi:hypothetical protein